MQYHNGYCLCDAADTSDLEPAAAEKDTLVPHCNFEWRIFVSFIAMSG
jgi:hypothetical protein